MMDLKSPWGRSEWEKSIETWGEELHHVLSNEHIQREAADWDTAREVCEVLGECRGALLIRQTHASLGHLPCLYTRAWEQRQINYCNVGKHQDKMTWPRFDSLVSLLPHPQSVPSYFCSFKLLSKWTTVEKTEVRSWLTVTFLEYKRPHFSLCLCQASK